MNSERSNYDGGKTMKLNPPAALADYTYDGKAASRSSAPARIVGWLAFLSLIGTVLAFIFLTENKLLILGLSTIFFILFVVYVIFKISKRRLQCTQCGQNMEIIDVSWTPEEWEQKQGYKMIDGFKGADGNLYTVEKEKRSGSTHYFLHAHHQSWYACHQCRLYFLKARYWRETLFSSINNEMFEQAKKSLLTDPKASDKMKAAYRERLQGR
jgi:hypothetical protein